MGIICTSLRAAWVSVDGGVGTVPAGLTGRARRTSGSLGDGEATAGAAVGVGLTVVSLTGVLSTGSALGATNPPSGEGDGVTVTVTEALGAPSRGVIR